MLGVKRLDGYLSYGVEAILAWRLICCLSAIICVCGVGFA